MALWAIQGVGLLINTIQSFQQANQMKQMQREGEADFRQMQAQFGPSKTDKPMGAQTKSIFNFEHPPFPEDNFRNLQESQMGQAKNRQVASNSLHQDLQDMKNSFFEENHYETERSPEGKPRVATDEQGRPQVAKGAESPDQKMARMELETQAKAGLAEKHADQKETFLKEEKQTLQEFLAKNKDHLDNPTVHDELQKMVVTSKKKALQLQQNHEDERLRVDMPPEHKMALRLEHGTRELRKMDEENVKFEEESPDAKAIMEHDHKVAAILGEQKEKARQDRKEDEFLNMDPRKMMAARAQQNQGPKDVGDHLPAYLAAHLYDVGVYSV